MSFVHGEARFCAKNQYMPAHWTKTNKLLHFCAVAAGLIQPSTLNILPWKAHLAMLTLIWFLFGMNSYVIFLQNLFRKTHTVMVSLW